MNTPTQSEIDDVLNKCMDAENSGTSIYPGMSYEQGVRAGIEWMTGESGNPIEED